MAFAATLPLGPVNVAVLSLTSLPVWLGMDLVLISWAFWVLPGLLLSQQTSSQLILSCLLPPAMCCPVWEVVDPFGAAFGAEAPGLIERFW